MGGPFLLPTLFPLTDANPCPWKNSFREVPRLAAPRRLPATAPKVGFGRRLAYRPRLLRPSGQATAEARSRTAAPGTMPRAGHTPRPRRSPARPGPILRSRRSGPCADKRLRPAVARRPVPPCALAANPNPEGNPAPRALPGSRLPGPMRRERPRPDSSRRPGGPRPSGRCPAATKPGNGSHGNVRGSTRPVPQPPPEARYTARAASACLATNAGSLPRLLPPATRPGGKIRPGNRCPAKSLRSSACR